MQFSSRGSYREDGRSSSGIRFIQKHIVDFNIIYTVMWRALFRTRQTKV